MATYLLTWNPSKWPLEEMEALVAKFQAEGRLLESWGCGGTKRIAPGDQVFLLRQGKEPRGLVGAGVATSEVYSRTRWGSGSGKANYVDVEWEFIDSEPLIPRQALDAGALSAVHWNTLSSGIEIPPAAASEIWILWESMKTEPAESSTHSAVD